MAIKSITGAEVQIDPRLPAQNLNRKPVCAANCD